MADESHDLDADDIDAMMDILCTTGLQSLYPKFKENKVGPREVEALSEEQFTILGVYAVGDRARLKQKCKDFIKGRSLDSPTVKKYMELMSHKSTKPCRRGKSTRKIYIGWKNMNEKGVYSLMHPSKGGGQHIKDINKDATLAELQEILCNEYFPDGVCLSSNMHLKDYDKSVVNYAGHLLPETVCDEPFTVGRYSDARKCTPIRIYLQTKKKSMVSVSSSVMIESNKEDMDESVEKNSDDDFEMADFHELGTPTVCLNQRGRNRLSLTQRRDRNQLLQDRPVTHNTCLDQTPLPSQSTSQQITTSLQQMSSALTCDPCTYISQVTDLPAQHSEEKYFVYTLQSDSDSEIQEAIRKSIEPKPTFETALQNWQKQKLDNSDVNVILVNRNDVFESLKRAQMKKAFSWLKPVKILFSGEDGEDFGGPRREFFGLLMKEVRRMIGDNGSLQHSINKADENLYHTAGKLIVWSVLQGGEGCPILSSSLFEMLLGNDKVELSLDDVRDFDSKEFITQLNKAEVDDQIPADWLIDIGISPPFSVEKKEKLVQLVLKQIVFYRIHVELSQFREGLNSFSFLESLKEYREGLRSVLCIDQNKRLTLVDFKKVLDIEYSPEGSNRRKEEQDSIYALELFIQDCCDDEMEVNEGHLLHFWTGSSSVPPLGWEKNLVIKFVEEKDRLPVAHTCEMSLVIPRGLTPEQFKKKMMIAIQWGGQFHLV